MESLMTLFNRLDASSPASAGLCTPTPWSNNAPVMALAVALVLCIAVAFALLWRQQRRMQGLGAALVDAQDRASAADTQLAELEQSLAATLASIDAGFIAADREGRVTRLNRVSEQITGWSQVDAIGLPIWQVFQREDRPPEHLALNPVDLMLSQGVTIADRHTVIAISRSGQRTPLEVRATLTHHADGSACGLVMVCRDLTALQAAQMQHQRLAAIVESSSDAIIGKTLDGRITDWNAGAETLFGYSADEAIGRSVLMLIPAERADEEMRIVDKLSHGHRVPPFDTLRLHRDGRLLEVSIAVSPILDAAGHIVGAAKIVRDVSAKRRAEQARLRAQQLEAENRQILEASRMKSQFLANMSHELRTPLNAVIGFADLLRSGAVAPSSPQHGRFLGHIATSGRHLLQMINDVLDLSKVEAGQLEFHPEAVELPQLVQEVFDVLHSDVLRKRLRHRIDIADGLTGLRLDPARLKQALYNYLSNAIKFTPEGGSIALSARPEGAAMLRIEVEDSGIGIAEADLPRLFVEFQQLDAGLGRQHGGTGLGLALTRRLVQAQGGDVGVRSTPGQGSVFHLVLPRLATAGATGLPASAVGPGRLLVVEPDMRSREQLVQALAHDGYRADAAAGATQALAQAADQAYDGITLQMLLPVPRGLGLLSDIRQRGASRGTPVLGMAFTAEPGRAAVFAVADVLAKPIDSLQVVAAMRRCGLLEPAGQAVLVVDDEAPALELMQSTLAAAGLLPHGERSGPQALAVLDAVRPSAIVLDLMMPGMDGFAVLDALQALPAWRDTPVFIWTSMVLADEDYARLSGSARAILDKGGGTLQSLLARLRAWRPRSAPVLPVIEGDAP